MRPIYWTGSQLSSRKVHEEPAVRSGKGCEHVCLRLIHAPPLQSTQVHSFNTANKYRQKRKESTHVWHKPGGIKNTHIWPVQVLLQPGSRDQRACLCHCSHSSPLRTPRRGSAHNLPARLIRLLMVNLPVVRRGSTDVSGNTVANGCSTAMRLLHAIQWNSLQTWSAKDASLPDLWCI